MKLQILSRAGTSVLVLMMVFLFSIDAAAALLQGTVQGKTGAPKGFVRVDLYGPDNRKTFTDQDGKFMADLREGEYTVQISERDRVLAFKVRLPQQGLQKTFVLEWR